ncbi:hypothetical protein ABK040_000320 [Willaertia magna]
MKSLLLTIFLLLAAACLITCDFYSLSDAEVDALFASLADTSSELSSGQTLSATQSLNVRSGPCTSNKVVVTIPPGGKVQYTGTTKSGCGYTWYSIKYNGKTGYAASNWLKASSSSNPTPAPAPVSGSTVNCGQAYDKGRAIGEKRCVKIDGKNVVDSTAARFNAMKQAAAQSGVHIKISSGFRTNAEQQYFYNCYKTKKCNNGNLAAAPGYSNHQNGIALDLNVSSGGVYNWLVKNASRFGFVRTVPSETWHWEYRPGSRCNAFVSYSCN